MVESASRSAFNFVPTPLERQIAPQQPGTLLDVYQMGWKHTPGGDKSLSKLLPLLCAVGGIAGTVACIIGIISTIVTTGLIVFSIFILPLITALLGLGGVWALFRSSLCIAAFSEAFVYARNTRVTLLRWHEIARLDSQTQASKTAGSKGIYTLYTHDGRRFQWRAHPRLMQNMVKIMREHIA